MFFCHPINHSWYIHSYYNKMRAASDRFELHACGRRTHRTTTCSVLTPERRQVSEVTLSRSTYNKPQTPRWRHADCDAALNAYNNNWSTNGAIYDRCRSKESYTLDSTARFKYDVLTRILIESTSAPFMQGIDEIQAWLHHGAILCIPAWL